MKIGSFTAHMRCHALACILLSVLLCGIMANADVHYVATNGANIHPYTTWSAAATNIQWAVNAATASDTVLVSNGTYYLTNQVSIAAAITCASVNGREVTIVDGNYPHVTNRCFYINGNGVTLDGFTVSNGFSFGNGSVACGGGIYAYAVSGYLAKVQNCKITGNTSSNYMSGGVTNNAYGGGIYCYNRTIVSNCEIDANRVAGRFAQGGGVYLVASSTNIDCIIASNILIKGSVGAEGQAAWINDSSCAIDSCKICWNCTGTTNYSTVALNYGAILRNSLVCNNSSIDGAVKVYNCWGRIQNCTIVSNSSSGAGYASGGIYIWQVYNYTSYIENVVCYLNTAVSGQSNFLSYDTGSFSIVNSCISPTSSFPINVSVPNYYFGNIESNPQFVNKDSNDFHLAQGSPCINSGMNENWMTLDFDGHSRIDRFSGIVDMGCYEYLPQGIFFSVP